MAIGILLIVLLLVVVLMAGWFGRNVNCSEQLMLYGSLKDVSSIIFGVMGAWIAILYPQGLKSIFSLKSSLDRNFIRVRRLMFPTRCAAIVIVVSLSFEFLLPVARQVRAAEAHVAVFRGGSFCLVVSLLVLLTIGLLRTFANLEEANDHAKRSINADAAKRRVRSQARTSGASESAGDAPEE